MLLVGSALEGYEIHASDGKIGTVSDLLFDDTTWKVRWIVVDVGTWLSGRKVLIHPSAIVEADHRRQELAVRLTKAKVKDSPDILQDRPVSQQMESDLYSYYNWDPAWGADYFAPSVMSSGAYFTDTMLRDPPGLGLRLSDGDPHLRSITTVKGYHVHATDGEIGHIENLLLDDANWHINYLIIDTKNWWFGKHVLVSPFAVRAIIWDEKEIQLDITRDRVKNSPPWDPLAAIDRAYERELHGYYGWPGYGW